MDLNKVMIIWRVTNEVEVKKIWDTWRSVVNFNVATNRRYKNSEWNTIEEAEFHKCVAFGPLADIIWNYWEKWKKIYVEWRLRTRKWEDTNWANRYTTEIVSDNVIFLDSKWSVSDSANSSDSQASQSDDEDLPF